MLLNGASTAMVEASRHDDHLSGDAVASFDAAHTELRRAFTAPAALDQTVHHGGGDRTGRELLLMRTVEYAVHGWDLSQAIQIDDTIPTPLASFLVRAVEASRFLLGGSRGAFSPKPYLWILLSRRKCACSRSPDARRSGQRSRSDISNARKIGGSGFQWAFWACGVIGLAAVPVTYLLVRHNELATAVARTSQKPQPAPADV